MGLLFGKSPASKPPEKLDLETYNHRETTRQCGVQLSSKLYPAKFIGVPLPNLIKNLSKRKTQLAYAPSNHRHKPPAFPGKPRVAT
jgi:hypothetical protein